MRKILFIVTFIFCSFNLYSQWGVKGGFTYSTISNMEISKYKPSAHIGVSYDIKLSDKWYIQPDLLFTSVGCKLKDDGLVLKKGHVYIYALELPVNMSFRPNIANNTNLLIDFGLYARYGLFGNKTYEYYDSPKVDDKPFDAYNRFDIGLNVGLGVQKNRCYGILSFQRGLSHAEKDFGSYHQIFKLSLGYKF